MKKLNIIKKVFKQSHEIKNRNFELAIKIKEHYSKLLDNKKSLVVLSVANGGTIVCSEIIGMINLQRPSFSTNVFPITASSYKDGIKPCKEVKVDLSSLQEILTPSGILNNHVLIVDDIYETGYTLKTVYDAVNKLSPKSIEIAVLFKRESSHKVLLNTKFVGFEVNEEGFLVGFGLDFKGKHRELSYVGFLDEDRMAEEPFDERVCNLCGQTCLSPYGRDLNGKDVCQEYGMLNTIVQGGFCSPALQDCTAYRFDLCEHCLKKLFDSFAVPVEEIEYDIWDGHLYG